MTGLISMRDATSRSSSSEEAKASNDDPKMGKRCGTGLNVIPGGFSVLVVSLIVVVTVSALVQPLNANPTCILNCAQCVKIYGDYFDGHSCAKVCMESRSRFDSFVDCADPTTIARFLKTY